jgi:ligand-binding sensor domain-containing protein
VRLASGIIILLVSAESLLALNPGLAVSRYLHTTWTQEEGADLPSVQAIAQTHDGYLWLGTGSGLIRFDGIRFVHWKPRTERNCPAMTFDA